MTQRQSTRRRFLELAGATAITGLAGCSTQGSPSDATQTQTTAAETTATANETATTTAEPVDGIRGPRKGDDLPTDPKPDDGFPPEFDEQPETRRIDTSAYDTLTRESKDGTTVEVPLVPIEDAYYWYARGEARFVDARSETGYEVSHVFGAVHSPAPTGRRHDPTDDWSKDEPVVTYCHCPHHLSSLRAADLIESGFENVYAIDEGYQAWLDRNYPLAGSDTDRSYTVRTIRGTTSPADAGETAWAMHPPTDQVEATEIAADGSYELELKFVQVDGSSTIRIETPSYTIEAPLRVLTNTTVTAETGTASGDDSTNATTTTTNATATTTNATGDRTETTADSAYSFWF